MAKGPFDDELTPEEEQLLKTDDTIPPAEDDEGATVETPAAEAKPGAAAASEPKPAAEAAPAEVVKPPAEAEADAEDKALADFLEKHKDKSPEELARLAFQQSKRASKEAATNRQVREQVGALAERSRQAAARRDEIARAAPNMLEEFKKKLAEDPDGATEMIFESLLNRQVNEADVEAATARIDEAIVFADAHIPEFGKQWPQMHALANELGFSDNEINGIDDARTLIVLSLANHAARLMKGGVMDRYGNIVNVPEMQTTPLDPRLAAPTPQRTLSGGARSAKSNVSVADQLSEILAMSPDQFDKFDRENPGVIEGLMKQAA